MIFLKEKNQMKRINISCASHASTAICNSMEPQPYSSASRPPPSSSLVAAAPQLVNGGGGGRAIDRHNPIITNERRRVVAVAISGGSTTTEAPANSDKVRASTSAAKSAQHNKIEELTANEGVEAEKEKKKKKKSDNNVKRLIDFGKNKKKKKSKAEKQPAVSYHDDDDKGGDQRRRRQKQVVESKRKSYSVLQPPRSTSELRLMKGCAAARPGEDYISPSESLRYLLADPGLKQQQLLLDGFSDDPVFFSLPDQPGKKKGHDDDDDDLSSKKVPKPPPSITSAATSHQVVVLRVSLHCKGCEGKVRKHISRMKGVVSFNIDFAEKRVTVVGDVTPLGVLSSISKVKNAQLWTPPSPVPQPPCSTKKADQVVVQQEQGNAKPKARQA
ncbi:hypothetical protein Dimus_007271 [Dionaea muscipula]